MSTSGTISVRRINGIITQRSSGLTVYERGSGLPGPPGPSGPPSGPAGGVLGGTFPDPSFAEDMATQGELDAEPVLDQALLQAGDIVQWNGEALARLAAGTEVKSSVTHGIFAAMARPIGLGQVEWIGSVTPTNALPGDTWLDTSGSTITRDTFTGTDGTNLESHTGETGATWTSHPSYTASAKILGNRVYGNSAGTARAYYASGVPSSADYSVEAQIRTFTQVYSSGIFARMSTAADTGYMMLFNGSGYLLYKGVAGTYTAIGTATTSAQQFYVDTAPAAADRYLRLVVRGGTPTRVLGYVNGVLALAAVDSSSPITATGRPGLIVQSTATTASHIDQFVAVNRSITPTLKLL